MFLAVFLNVQLSPLRNLTVRVSEGKQFFANYISCN